MFLLYPWWVGFFFFKLLFFLQFSLPAFGKPPSGHLRSHHKDKAFKYRGTLFRPSSAHCDNVQIAAEENNKKEVEERDDTSSSSIQEQTYSPTMQNKKMQIKPRRIQSAKGRLEGPSSKNELQNCKQSSGPVSFAEDNKKLEKKPSVVNINAAVDIPDKEESDLVLRANILYRGQNEINKKQRVRPSSAKSTLGYPVSSAEKVEKDHHPAREILKPSVYGLKLGRQVFGNDSNIQEAWANTARNYPFKLKENEESQSEIKKKDEELEAR